MSYSPTGGNFINDYRIQVEPSLPPQSNHPSRVPSLPLHSRIHILYLGTWAGVLKVWNLGWKNLIKLYGISCFYCSPRGCLHGSYNLYKSRSQRWRDPTVTRIPAPLHICISAVGPRQTRSQRATHGESEADGMRYRFNNDNNNNIFAKFW